MEHGASSTVQERAVANNEEHTACFAKASKSMDTTATPSAPGVDHELAGATTAPEHGEWGDAAMLSDDTTNESAPRFLMRPISPANVRRPVLELAATAGPTRSPSLRAPTDGTVRDVSALDL